MRGFVLCLVSCVALVTAATGVLAATTISSMPWRDGAAVADGWTMGIPGVPITYRYALTAGTGAIDGMSGPQALFLTAERAPQLRYLERRLPLAAWQGRRMRVMLRLKNQDDARGYANFYINNSDGSRLVAVKQTRTGFHQGDWQVVQFVADVPANAADLVIRASLFGPGTVWIDRPVLDGVGKDVSADDVRPFAALIATDASPPAPVPPGPGAFAVSSGWHPKVGFRGAALSLYMGSATNIRLQAGDGALSGDATVHSENSGSEPLIAFARFGGLENDVSLQEWRGKRLRVTLRLKDQGGARAYAIAQVNRVDGDAGRTLAQRNAPGAGGWQTHQFVVDVPDDGSHLYVYAGFTGKGAAQVEGLTLEAVNADVPLSPEQKVYSGGPMAALPVNGDIGIGNGPAYTPWLPRVEPTGPNPPR